MPIRRSRESGDTLIEVLIAITVLAVIIVGSFSLMNKGVAQMYDSMERAQVRQLIERQVESLTYARDQYLRQQTPGAIVTGSDAVAASAWVAVKSAASVSVPAADNCTDPTSAFYIGRKTANGTNPSANDVELRTSVLSAVSTGFPQPGDGIWIQKVAGVATAPVPYIDFYLRACWRQTSSPAMQVESSIVRLYDK